MTFNVRHILPTELTAFAQITDRPQSIERFSHMVTTMWDSGESKPAWCFVIENEGQLLGRIGYMTLDGRADAVTIFGWTLPWDDDYLVLGTELLAKSVAILRQQGVQTIQRELYSVWGTLNAQRETLEAAGFGELQAQCVYELAAAGSQVNVPTRLQFKSLAEVGEVRFCELIQQATAGTPDRGIQQLIEQVGLEQFVIDSNHMLAAEHDVLDDWWCVAFSADKPIGFIQPVQFKNSTEGNIAYLGVLPDMRGNGYGFDLLAAGTAKLLEAGIELIIGRTDTDNIPMQRTFEKLGYQLESRVWTYEHRNS